MWHRRFAIGAVLLGADRVKGVDSDPGAVRVATENAELLDTEVGFIVADVKDEALRGLLGSCDTVIMNPPFGAQKDSMRIARLFDLALSLAPVTYSIFNAGSAQFIETYTAQRAKIDEKVGGVFPLRRTFSFHTQDVMEIEVEILRLIRI